MLGCDSVSANMNDDLVSAMQGPIGVFDSGFGGLSIFRKIRETLPDFDYVYLGDNARAPYGNRSFEAVLRFTTECVEYLFSLGCPLVVIACNTASAKALRSIQQGILAKHYPSRRVLGVIRPTVEVLENFTHSGHVALWGTTGTVKSSSFAIEIDKYAPRVTLVQQACPLLVPLIEAGELQGEGLAYFIRKYWEQTRSQDSLLDALLLACTHYPLILEEITEQLPAHVRVIAQDDLVAVSLKDYLSRHSEMLARLTQHGTCQFLTTDLSDHFDHLAEVFMGHPIRSETVEVA